MPHRGFPPPATRQMRRAPRALTVVGAEELVAKIEAGGALDFEEACRQQATATMPPLAPIGAGAGAPRADVMPNPKVGRRCASTDVAGAVASAIRNSFGMFFVVTYC
jgi:ribosomal protein L1